MNENYPPPAAQDRGADIPERPNAQVPTRQAHAPVGPPPAPRRGGFMRGFGGGIGFGLGLGVMFTVASLLSVLALAGSLTALAPSETTSTNVTTVWGSGSDTLRAVNVTGPILADASDGALLAGGTFGNEIAQQIDDLEADDAGALVLLVNTPGGSIGGSRAISDAVERYQDRTGHKALVHVTSMSASGGVYATASADEIISDHGAFVGSIGVIFGPFQQYDGVVATTGNILESGVTTTGGITEEYLTAGKGKDFGNPYRPITDEERANYAHALNVEYDNFVSHVSQHRGIPEETIVDELGAFLFDPQTAQGHGLIDGVMGRDEFYRHAAEVAGFDPDNTRVEAVRAPSAWESLFGVERAIGTAPAVEQGAGVVPALSSSFCASTQPLAFAGDLASVCN